MSTQAERSEIAVLQTQMGEVIKRLDKIDKKLDDQGLALVPRTEFDAFKKAVRVNYAIIVVLTALVTAMAYALIVGRHQ